MLDIRSSYQTPMATVLPAQMSTTACPCLQLNNQSKIAYLPGGSASSLTLSQATLPEQTGQAIIKILLKQVETLTRVIKSLLGLDRTALSERDFQLVSSQEVKKNDSSVGTFLRENAGDISSIVSALFET